MVEVRKGDLFEAGTDAIVNTVNCVGAMGKGIALEFRHRYPQMYSEYMLLCKRKSIEVGRMWFWWTETPCPRYVVNFPTKQDWRNPSKIEWISAGLDDLKNRVILLEIESIALPALGCTNGGLRFEDVRALIGERLNDLEIPVILYEPQ